MGAGPIGLVLADAGYLTVGNLAAPGPHRLIAVGKHRERQAGGGPGSRSREIESGA